MKFPIIRIDGQTKDFSHEKCQCCVSDDNISTIILDFGQIPVDSTAVKSLIITNDTGNEQYYEVNRDPTNTLDIFFHFDKYNWSLDPSCATVCQLRYNPLIPNQNNVDYFAIVNCDKAILKIIARGPEISISLDELTMVCHLNEIARKRLKLVNKSSVPARFMFDFDEKQSFFKPDPYNGCIGANSHIYIVITFAPTVQGQHPCLLPCLIHHQAPIMIRLYGYCGKQYSNEKDFVIPTLVYPPKDKNGFAAYTWDSVRTRLFQSSDLISLSKNCIDFGRCEPNKSHLESACTTSLTRHGNTDVLVQWEKDVDRIFSLTPINARVKKDEPCLIEVRFDPKIENTFYDRELKGFAQSSGGESLNSRQIFSSTIITSLRLMGHTFSSDSSSWIPQYEVPKSIIMPPCLPFTPVYTTFMLKRFGHLPLMYRFIPPQETCFIVKPSQGVIRKNYQVIIVEMFPTIKNKLLYERWAIRFNGNPDYETFVDFQGYAEYPSLSFDDFVEFPSTHPGCEQSKHVFILNPTRHRINYRYEDIPLELTIDQIEGQIYANEIVTHKFLFRPLQEGDYELSVTCCYFVVCPLTSRGSEAITEIRVKLGGKCERGYLEATPRELCFGELAYNESKELSFQLTNSGNVVIPYEFDLRYQNWPYEEKTLEHPIQLIPISGNLFPGEEEKIQATLLPLERGYHEITILYSIRKSSKSYCFVNDNVPSEICRIKYFCHLPVIVIQDLLHHRMGDNISKHVLWRLLNINEFNRVVNDLQPRETQNLTMNVPPMIVQNDISIVKLLISNPTSAVENWSLKQIKLCSCTKTSEKRGFNVYSMKYNCLHRKLCTFSPKTGTLKAHEKMVVTMELRWTILGESTIKWDLDMGHDRHISLSININCLADHERTAFLLYGPTIELKNIHIGDKDPINQICWLYNPTKNDVPYFLNTVALNKFNKNHYSAIFHCLNPSGVVRKLSYEPVIIKFQPRKCGKSEVKVPITIGTEKTEITIKGQGTNDLSRGIAKAAPHHDLFHISEIPVHFSMNNITLPRMPLHGRATRMIMIYNRLEDELVAYTWKKYEIPGILKIDVEPQTGRIQPDSLQSFRLIVATGGKPCRINGEVICEFVNQSQKRAYERSVVMHEKLCDEMKDYFTITENGMTVPKPPELCLQQPKPFYKVLTVKCYIYSPQDERLKILPKEILKNTPPIEIPMGKKLMGFSVPREMREISTFILEGMIWNILQTPNICKSSKPVLRYSQIAMRPLQRKRIQERSYVKPSSRLVEKLLENMIFMIVHKEFSLDMTHLTHKVDARQATYPKIWQQVSEKKGDWNKAQKSNNSSK